MTVTWKIITLCRCRDCPVLCSPNIFYKNRSIIESNRLQIIIKVRKFENAFLQQEADLVQTLAKPLNLHTFIHFCLTTNMADTILSPSLTSLNSLLHTQDFSTAGHIITSEACITLKSEKPETGPRGLRADTRVQDSCAGLKWPGTTWHHCDAFKTGLVPRSEMLATYCAFCLVIYRLALF